MSSLIRDEMFWTRFHPVDLIFADSVCRWSRSDSPVLHLAAALASWTMQQGHSCCDLKAVGGRPFGAKDPDSPAFILPETEEFLTALRSAPPEIVFRPGCDRSKTAPLVLDEAGRLYLNRYYSYEIRIAAELARRSVLTRNNDRDWSALPEPPPGTLTRLSPWFKAGGELDYQQAAVFLAHYRNFMILTGGPGTGKTSVLTAILAWELLDAPQLRIKLCAPTGKAQNRMKESIAAELQQLTVPESVRDALRNLQSECSTIDRLLHPRPHSPNYRANRNDPLEADLVVLDEVSMSSLAQLGHLFDALKPETRLILIGDKDQLSPVEAGSVLADLIASGTANVMPPALAEKFARHTSWSVPPVSDSLPLSGCIAELKVNHRSAHAPVISRISADIRDLSTRPDEVRNLCREMTGLSSRDFSCHAPPKDKPSLQREIREFLRPAADWVKLAGNGTWADLRAAFELLESCRILCAVRQGVFGVENINRIAAEILNLHSAYSVGMPLMILTNTPSLGVFNGDVGMVWENREDAGLEKPEKAVMFPSPVSPNGFRAVRLPELPEHEPVFAMTVHKSQGSGFPRVMILLPPKDLPLLTRELVYTAITRAESGLRLFSTPEILYKSMRTKTIRYSGLRDRLKENLKNES